MRRGGLGVERLGLVSLIHRPSGDLEAVSPRDTGATQELGPCQPQKDRRSESDVE